MKALSQDNYTIRPFRATKPWDISYTYLTDSNESVFINEAIKAPSGWQWGVFPEPENTNGIKKYTLFESAQNLFYGSGSTRIPEFGKLFSPTGAFYTVNISQAKFGERIRPGSFVLSSPSTTASFVDDGNGRITPAHDTSSIIGNIFYSQGVVVIQKTLQGGSITGSIINSAGLSLTTGSSLNIKFDSQVTIFEHTIMATLEKEELNYSSNPSLALFKSSSVSGSIKLFDTMASGTLHPYITQIGFYNNNYELLAIAKFPHPIKRAPEIQQTFVVRFDI